MLYQSCINDTRRVIERLEKAAATYADLSAVMEAVAAEENLKAKERQIVFMLLQRGSCITREGARARCTEPFSDRASLTKAIVLLSYFPWKNT